MYSDCSRFQGRIKEKYFIFWLIINKAQLNLYSADTYVGPKGVPWIEVPLYSSPQNCTDICAFKYSSTKYLSWLF